MKHPMIKLVGTLVMLCALLFAYYQTIYSRIESESLKSIQKTSGDKLNSIIEAMESLTSEKAHRMNVLSSQLRASAKL